MTHDRLLALALDAFPGGALVTDAKGVPVHVNSRARDVVNDAHLPLAEFLTNGGRGKAYVQPLQEGETQVGWAVFTVPAQLLGKSLDDIERRVILETFEACERRVAETARRLGISRVTLWRRLRAYAVAPPSVTAAPAPVSNEPRFSAAPRARPVSHRTR